MIKIISGLTLFSFTITQLGLNYLYAFPKINQLRAPNGTSIILNNKLAEKPEWQNGEEYKNIRVKAFEQGKNKIELSATNLKTEETEPITLNIYPALPPDHENIIQAAGNHEVVKKILELLHKENVSFYTLDNLIKDFASFTSEEHNLIATHSSIANDPIAMNRQICAYLLKKGSIHLKLTDNSLIVTDEQQNILGEINISQQTWNAFKGEKWGKDWRDNQYYLLKLFQREIFGAEDNKLVNRINDFYYSMKYFRLNYYLIPSPAQSPFSHLYDETKEIFDNLLNAAKLEGATLVLLEDDKPTAFANRENNIVAVSTGLFKILKKEELTKDAIAFILAHEIRHLQQRRAESHAESFGKEMDSDVQALDLINLAGYNILEATKYFIEFKEIDKTAELNSKLGTIFTTAMELVDEHDTTERRIEDLEGIISEGNWSKTDDTTPFSDQATEEISKETELKVILKKIEKIETFADLENLLKEVSAESEYANTVLLYGMTKISGARANKIAEKIKEILVEKKLLEYPEDLPVIMERLLFLSSVELLENEDKIVAAIVLTEEFIQQKKEFDAEYLKFFNSVLSKNSSFNQEIVKASLYMHGLDVFCTTDILGDSRRKERFRQINRFFTKVVETDEIKEFDIFFIPSPDRHNLKYNSNLAYTIYIEDVYKKTISEKLHSGNFSWDVVVKLLKKLDKLQKERGIKRKDLEISFYSLAGMLLSKKELNEAGKINLILDFPFLALESENKISQGIAELLFNYYKKNKFSDKNIEKLLKTLFVHDVGSNGTIMIDLVSKDALEMLKDGKTKLLDLFIFEAGWIVAIPSDILTKLFLSWERERKIDNKKSDVFLYTMIDKFDFLNLSKKKSNQESLEMMEPIIQYYLTKIAKQDNLADNDLYIVFYLRLFFSNHPADDEKIKKILQQANIHADVSKLSEMTKNLIYFFSKGAVLSLSKFHEQTKLSNDYDLNILAEFLNSNSMLTLHPKQEKRGVIALPNLASIFDVAEDKTIPQDWAEYIMFLNLRIFFNKINVKDDIENKLSELENVFNVFLQDKKRLEKESLIPSLGAKKAKKEISETYEPLFKKLFANFPFYADRTYLSKDREQFFKKNFSFIFDSPMEFTDLLRIIKTYLPPSPLTNFILFSLFLREVKKEYPAENIYDLNYLKKILVENKELQEKFEKIAPYFTNDKRLFLRNSFLLGYLVAKIEEAKTSGIGAEDDFVSKMKRLMPKNTVLKPNHFEALFYRFAPSFRLAANVAGLLIIPKLTKFFFLKGIYRRTLKRIIKEMQYDERFLEEENNDRINSIIANYYYLKIVSLIFHGDDFVFLRKRILRYLTRKRTYPKIDSLFFDFNHANKWAQFDAVSLDLQEKGILDTINSQKSFQEKLANLCSKQPAKQPAMDEYLEILFNQEIALMKNDPSKITQERLDLIRTNTDKFHQAYFSEHYTLKILALARNRAGELTLPEEIALIEKYFPKASYLRDDLLKSVLAKVEDPEDYHQRIVGLFYADKRDILENKDKMQGTYWEEKMKIFGRKISNKEKKDSMLWILGIKPMPLFMREYEELQGVSYHRFKDMYALSGGSDYPYAGESSRNVLIQEMFIGENGILSNDRIFMEFMEEILNFILKNTSLDKSISTKTVRKIFYGVLLNSNQRKKLEIVKALAMNFGPLLQAGTEKKYSYTEVFTKFMESMGIYGIKAGQTIAASSDIDLPEELRTAFENLTNQAKLLTKKMALETFHNYRIKTIKRLGRLISAASIKIVYEAEMLVGGQTKTIAVKIKRPDVAHNLIEDSEIFKKICAYFRAHGIKIPDGFEDSTSVGIKKDADFLQEIKNTHLLEKQLPEINQEENYRLSPKSKEKNGMKVEFLVPGIFAGSNDKIIFTELIGGDDLVNEKALLQKDIVSQEELKELKIIIFDFLMTQLFSKGLYLADPHGGNFRIVRENGVVKVYLIDIGSLEEVKQDKYGDMLKSLAYMNMELKVTDNRFILPALFFKKTGYLTKGTMGYDEILELIFSKMAEENKPFKTKEDFEKTIRSEIIIGVVRRSVSIPQFIKIATKTILQNLSKEQTQKTDKRSLTEQLLPVKVKKFTKNIYSSL
ncbi:MAG: AarF/UbiB family protein [Elusimicrobiota bacterium]